MGWVRIVGADNLTGASVDANGSLRVQVFAGQSGAANISVVGSINDGFPTLNAVTGNATGASTDFNGIVTTITMVAVGTDTLTGTLTIEGSLDGTTWVSSGATVALTAGATVQATSTGKAFRFFRASLSGAGGAGSVTAKILGTI